MMVKEVSIITAAPQQGRKAIQTGIGQKILQKDFFRKMKLIEHLMCLTILRVNSDHYNIQKNIKLFEERKII